MLIGEIYIEARRGRVMVSRRLTREDGGFIIERATNWRDIEEVARETFEARVTPAGSTTGIVPCPQRIERLARFPRYVDADWIPLSRARDLSNISYPGLSNAIERGDLDVMYTPEGRKMRREVRRSQVETLWLRPTLNNHADAHRLRWLADHGILSEEQIETARFWQSGKVDYTEGQGPHGHCWEWRGGISSRGYGIYWEGGTGVPAHRKAYELAHGHKLPADTYVLHDRERCGNPICVRPEHLVLSATPTGAPPREGTKAQRTAQLALGEVSPNGDPIRQLTDVQPDGDVPLP